MATLYLHIGTPKTGTTAIQCFCEKNAELLAERGFCFPLFPERYEKVGRYRNAHFLIEPGRSPGGEALPPEEGEVWRRHMDDIERLLERHPNAILTDEAIWGHVAKCYDTLRQLKAEADRRGFEVRIIAYLRRQDQYLDSSWAQRIKTNRAPWNGMKWEEALEKSDTAVRFDYLHILELLAGIFGKDRVIVRVYERKRFPNGDVVADFLDALGLQMDEGYAVPDGDINPSVWGNALEIKRILNPLVEEKPREEALMGALCAANYEHERREHGSYAMFSRGQLDDFLARYAESNRAVAREFLGSDDEPLFTPPGELPPKWEANGSHMYEDVVRFFGLVFLHQQEEMEEMKEKIYLKRKLKRIARVKLKALKARLCAAGKAE